MESMLKQLLDGLSWSVGYPGANPYWQNDVSEQHQISVDHTMQVQMQPHWEVLLDDFPSY